jgi:ferredoxin
MRVWIDHAQCCGVGVCVDACPSLFALASDGLAYVDLGGRAYGSNEPATVSDDLLEPVLDAAEDCPQDCIYIDA